MKQRLQNNWSLLWLIVVAVLIIFYGLGNTRLMPWDEAWYGSIARNLLSSKNWWELTFNSKPFWDHPPLGFWLMALSMKWLGQNEWAVRFPAALAGVLGVAMCYLAGKKIKNKYVGIIAAVILLTSRWYLVRARTANLESLLLLSQLVVFYFVISVDKTKNLWKLWLALAISLMTKSLISLSLLPLVIMSDIQIRKREKKYFSFFPIALFLGVSSFWYIWNTIKFGTSFLERNVLEIAFRKNIEAKWSVEVLKTTWIYFRSAVHQWYWFEVISSLVLFLLSIKGKYVKLSIYLLLVSFPYLIASKTEIWHLLPVMPPLSLAVGVVIAESIDWFGGSHKKLLYILSLLVVAGLGIKMWNDFRPSLYLPKSESFEAKLAISASKINLPIYLQDTTYVPSVIFYADKPISLIWDDKKLVNTLQRPFQIITRNFMLSEAKDYVVVDYAGDTVLAIFK